jgi:hypothetical protein
MSKYQVGELVEYWLHSKGKGPGEKTHGIVTKVLEYNTYTILGANKHREVSRRVKPDSHDWCALESDLQKVAA